MLLPPKKNHVILSLNKKLIILTHAYFLLK